jgi:RNA polymerase sigma factor (sigma-70 family)
LHPPLEFEVLVSEHQQMVFRTLVRLLGTREGMDDLAQDVFLRLYRALPGFRGDAQISTYLYRIVVNVAQDAKRRRGLAERRSVSLTEEAEAWEERLAHPARDAEQQLQARELGDAVERALGELRPTERAVLVLYHQEERSYEEIAVALQLPVNTVRTHLHRGRKRLRAMLVEQGGVCGKEIGHER